MIYIYIFSEDPLQLTTRKPFNIFFSCVFHEVSYNVFFLIIESYNQFKVFIPCLFVKKKHFQ